MATEIGRQPWIVQGLLKTKDAVSVVVPAAQIALTLTIFVAIYALLFVFWFRSMRRTIMIGPVEAALTPGYAAPAPIAGTIASSDRTPVGSEVTP
jgi:cytochrome bd ubiquinol oxidase subunit I